MVDQLNQQQQQYFTPNSTGPATTTTPKHYESQAQKQSDISSSSFNQFCLNELAAGFSAAAAGPSAFNLKKLQQQTSDVETSSLFADNGVADDVDKNVLAQQLESQFQQLFCNTSSSAAAAAGLVLGQQTQQQAATTPLGVAISAPTTLTPSGISLRLEPWTSPSSNCSGAASFLQHHDAAAAIDIPTSTDPSAILYNNNEQKQFLEQFQQLIAAAQKQQQSQQQIVAGCGDYSNADEASVSASSFPPTTKQQSQQEQQMMQQQQTTIDQSPDVAQQLLVALASVASQQQQQQQADEQQQQQLLLQQMLLLSANKESSQQQQLMEQFFSRGLPRLSSSSATSQFNPTSAADTSGQHCLPDNKQQQTSPHHQTLKDTSANCITPIKQEQFGSQTSAMSANVISLPQQTCFNGSGTRVSASGGASAGGPADAYCEICDKYLCNRYFLRTHKYKKHGILPPDGLPNSVLSASFQQGLGSKSSNSSPLKASANFFQSGQGSGGSFTNMYQSNTGDEGGFDADITSRSQNSSSLLNGGRSLSVSYPLFQQSTISGCGENNLTQLVAGGGKIGAARSTTPNPTASHLTNNNELAAATSFEQQPSNNLIFEQFFNQQQLMTESPSRTAFQNQGSQTALLFPNVHQKQNNCVTGGEPNSSNISGLEAQQQLLLSQFMSSMNMDQFAKLGSELVSPASAFDPLKQQQQSLPASTDPQIFSQLASMLTFLNGLQQQRQTVDGGSSNKNNDVVALGNMILGVAGSSSTTNQQQQPHEKRQYSSTSKNYCDICNKELCNKYFLRTHMLKMHNIVIDENKPVIANIDTTEREKVGAVSFRCDICLQDVRTRTELRNHKRDAHGQEMPTFVGIQPRVGSVSNSKQIKTEQMMLSGGELSESCGGQRQSETLVSSSFSPLGNAPIVNEVDGDMEHEFQKDDEIVLQNQPQTDSLDASASFLSNISSNSFMLHTANVNEDDDVDQVSSQKTVMPVADTGFANVPFNQILSSLLQAQNRQKMMQNADQQPNSDENDYENKKLDNDLYAMMPNGFNGEGTVNGEKLFQCQCCNASFETEIRLQVHKLIDHFAGSQKFGSEQHNIGQNVGESTPASKHQRMKRKQSKQQIKTETMVAPFFAEDDDNVPQQIDSGVDDSLINHIALQWHNEQLQQRKISALSTASSSNATSLSTNTSSSHCSLASSLFPCSLCRRSYKTIQRLDSHQRAVHHRYVARMPSSKQLKRNQQQLLQQQQQRNNGDANGDNQMINDSASSENNGSTTTGTQGFSLSPKKLKLMRTSFTCIKCQRRFGTRNECTEHIVLHLRNEKQQRRKTESSGVHSEIVHKESMKENSRKRETRIANNALENSAGLSSAVMADVGDENDLHEGAASKITEVSMDSDVDYFDEVLTSQQDGLAEVDGSMDYDESLVQSWIREEENGSRISSEGDKTPTIKLCDERQLRLQRDHNQQVNDTKCLLISQKSRPLTQLEIATSQSTIDLEASQSKYTANTNFPALDAITLRGNSSQKAEEKHSHTSGSISHNESDNESGRSTEIESAELNLASVNDSQRAGAFRHQQHTLQPFRIRCVQQKQLAVGLAAASAADGGSQKQHLHDDASSCTLVDNAIAYLPVRRPLTKPVRLELQLELCPIQASADDASTELNLSAQNAVDLPFNS